MVGDPTLTVSQIEDFNTKGYIRVTAVRFAGPARQHADLDYSRAGNCRPLPARSPPARRPHRRPEDRQQPDDDRHIRDEDGVALSASIVDMVLYIVNNYEELQKSNRSLVLYLPKIQTAEEASLWNEMMTALEDHLNLPVGTIKVYVLVEQLEETYQLMEIRAALGKHFVGYNTGRWDYINSVADAMGWDPEFINPNIESITMTYGYMKNYEDRVRRAVNTPDINGNYALWQGGMEPNIPVGSEEGVASSMEKAVAGAEREQREGASGKWVAHWKMVHIVRPVWEKTGESNQLGREFPPLTYGEDDDNGLTHLEPAPRTIRL